ncbi:plant intracellular Ras-group-related LRR protein 1-like [Wolffia australiana]
MKMEERTRSPSSSFKNRGAPSTLILDKEIKEEERNLNLSGMALASLPSPSFNPTLVTKLDLSNNNLESIPESTVARLLNVVELDLHSNELKTLPNSMGCLKKLKILNVDSNMLESLPKTIEDCIALEEISANFNQLTTLPETMGFELINLRKLSVSTNKLSSLPYSLSHLSALRVLDVHLNCLCCLPDGMENLTRLEILNVSQNFHHLRSLPPSIGLLSSLVELDISYNTIAVIPDSFSCLVALRKLQAQGNPFVSPPVDVVQQSVDTVRQYLTERMNGRFPPGKKRSWLGRFVKCGTFSHTMVVSDVSIQDDEELFLPQYRTIDGTASPRYLNLLSPRRLFSPKNCPRNSPRKTMI